MEFKVGDKLICIKEDLWDLELGKIYTVNLVDKLRPDKWIKVDEEPGDWWHEQECFRLYHEENEL